jgi:phage terminase large subunit
MQSITFSKKYHSLLNPDVRKKLNIRYIILTGGRGSGKSFAGNHLLHDLSFDADNVILHTRFTMTSAKISVIPELENAIEMRNSLEFFNITNNQILNKLTNAAINFKGLKTGSLQQTAQLKSVTNLNIWLLDEAEELCDENVFDDVDESIRRKGYENLIILMLNTYRITHEHFIYQRFFQQKGLKEGYNGVIDNVLYIHTDYTDNIKNLSKSFLNIVNETKKNNYEKYKYRYLGKFRKKAEGVIFKNWEFGLFDESLTYQYGLDFGVIDPDALIKVAIDKKNKTIYCHELMYKTGQSSDELYSNVKRNIDINKRIIADSAEKRLINDFSAKKLNIKKTKKFKGSVMTGIKIMLNYNIVITKDSQNLATELNNYCWSDKKGEVPIDDFNHAIDAIRYVVLECLYKNEWSFD